MTEKYRHIDVTDKAILKGVRAGLIEREGDSWVLTDLGDKLFLEFLKKQQEEKTDK